jgi:DNA end-binding protein Ku
MPHAVWKGSIQFGLVNIPVGLYPAEAPDDLDLDMLDRRSMAPVGYKRINKETGREIESDDIVKGYEISDGRYVVVTDQDLKRASPEATQTVDIVGFVDLDEIDPIYYDRPYYLAPTGQGAKAYGLLREALRKSGRVGIARLVVRTRQYVAAVYPRDRVLIAHLLRYSHELRDPDQLDLPAEGTSKLGIGSKEIGMAERLIEGMVEEWKPESFKDDYRDELLARIRKKAEEGEDFEVEEEPEEPRREAEVVDLMALLKQSISGGKGKPAEKPQPAGKAKPAKPAAKAAAKPKAKSPAKAKGAAAKPKPKAAGARRSA